jgi:hypothetical protein
MWFVGRKRREEVRDEDITGLKYFTRLRPMLDRLHEVGCWHLLSDDPRGIEIQTYSAIIACMLISHWMGRKPTLRTHEMICLYLMGWAEENELLAHLARLQLHAPQS